MQLENLENSSNIYWIESYLFIMMFVVLSKMDDNFIFMKNIFIKCVNIAKFLMILQKLFKKSVSI